MKNLCLWLSCLCSLNFGALSAREEVMVKKDGEKIRVACIGDSITFGAGIKDRDNESYPAGLQALLGDQVEVKNFGNSGRGVYLSTMRGKEKRGFFYQPEHQAALKFQPHIVICNLGINDVDDYKKGNAGDFVADYVKLLNEYKNLPTKPQIIIWTQLSPIAANGKGHRYRSENWREPFLIQNELREVARQTDAIEIDMDTPLRVPNLNALMPDNLHPNADGAKIIAATTAKVVRPLITGDFGGLQMADYFTSGAVLPHNVKFPVWGLANAGDRVDVEFNGEKFTTTANHRGQWRVEIPPQKANAQLQTLTIKTPNKEIKLDNIVVGELWLCAGQSNMLWELKKCTDAKNAVAFFPAANATPKANVHLLKMSPPNPDWQAWQKWRGKWEIANAANVNDFSGVAIFFAVARAKQHPQMPLGLIQVARGGAPLEAFLSRGALLTPDFIDTIAHYTPWYEHTAKYAPWCGQRAKADIEKATKAHSDKNTPAPDHNFAPGSLFNDGLAPFAQLPLTGILWYQGESNATTNLKPDTEIDAQYCEKGIRALIADWRQHFPTTNANGALPFLMVQLPRCDRPWASFRDVQWRVAQDTANVATIVATDTGVANDVHPRDKKAIGERLAAAAQRLVDGEKTAGIFPSAKNATAQDGVISVTFSPAGKIIATKIDNVEVETADGKIIAANAELSDGDNGTRLQVKYNGEKPVAIRYNWVNVPQGILMSDKNLPVAPFKLAVK